MNIKVVKEAAIKLSAQVDVIFEIVGCGVGETGIMLYIHESQIHYLSIIPDIYLGFNVDCEFMKYPRFA